MFVDQKGAIDVMDDAVFSKKQRKNNKGKSVTHKDALLDASTDSDNASDNDGMCYAIYMYM